MNTVATTLSSSQQTCHLLSWNLLVDILNGLTFFFGQGNSSSPSCPPTPMTDLSMSCVIFTILVICGSAKARNFYFIKKIIPALPPLLNIRMPVFSPKPSVRDWFSPFKNIVCVTFSILYQGVNWYLYSFWVLSSSFPWMTSCYTLCCLPFLHWWKLFV